MNEHANVVQVHMGDSLPPYLLQQLAQTRAFNPNIPIYLIMNEALAYDREAFDRLGVVVVRFESLVKCPHHRSFLRRSALHRKSLGGFWQYSSERFFALESFLECCRLKNVIHLENDVMLYMDLDEHLPVFSAGYESIALTMDADWRCIPGILYVKDAAAVGAMNEFILRSPLWKRINDMKSLGSYMGEVGSPLVNTLPIVPDEYASRFGLENARGEAASRRFYANNFSKFGGIFDAAAIGQYLGGIDPQHGGRETVGFINETAVFDPRRLGISWVESGGRLVPQGRIGDSVFSIFNLHIHSKRLSEFASDRRQDWKRS